MTSNEQIEDMECESLESGEIVKTVAQSTIFPFFPSTLPTSACFNIQNDNNQSEYIIRIIAQNPSNRGRDFLFGLFFDTEQQDDQSNDCKLFIDGDVKDSVFTYKSSADELVFVAKTTHGEHTISIKCGETENAQGIVSAAKFDAIFDYKDPDKQLDIKSGQLKSVLFTSMASSNEFPAIDVQIVSDPFDTLPVEMESLEDEAEEKVIEEIPNIVEAATSRRLMSENLKKAVKTVTDEAKEMITEDQTNNIDDTDKVKEMVKTEDKVSKGDESLNFDEIANGFQDAIDAFMNGFTPFDDESSEIDSLFPEMMSMNTMIQQIHIEPTPQLPVSLEGDIPLSHFKAIAYPLDVIGPELSFLESNIKQIKASIDTDYAFMFENDGDEEISITLKSTSVNSDFIKDIENDLHGLLPISDAEVDKTIEQVFHEFEQNKAPMPMMAAASFESYDESEHENNSESVFGAIVPILFLVLFIILFIAVIVFIKRKIQDLFKRNRSEIEEQEEAEVRAYYQMKDDYNTYPQINETQIAL